MVVWGPNCWSVSEYGRMKSEICLYCSLPPGSQVVEEEDRAFHPLLIIGGDQYLQLDFMDC